MVEPTGGTGSTTDGADDQDDCFDKQRRKPLSENVEHHVPARQCRHGAAEGAHVIARQPAALKGDREWVWADPSGDALYAASIFAAANARCVCVHGRWRALGVRPVSGGWQPCVSTYRDLREIYVT